MYELTVEGMTCGHCVKAVTQSLQALDREAKVDVDLAAKKVRVDTAAGMDAVSVALADAGYSVSDGKAV